jgi:psiF repeat
MAKALFLKSKREEQMKTAVVTILASFCIVTGVLADDSCKVEAEGKNLHGAALTSFTKKCCNDQADAQKLHGAAKTSFSKKCLSEAS